MSYIHVHLFAHSFVECQLQELYSSLEVSSQWEDGNLYVTCRNPSQLVDTSDVQIRIPIETDDIRLTHVARSDHMEVKIMVLGRLSSPPPVLPALSIPFCPPPRPKACASRAGEWGEGERETDCLSLVAHDRTDQEAQALSTHVQQGGGLHCRQCAHLLTAPLQQVLPLPSPYWR